MTNIERFQKLQVELVRAGFGTDLRAHPRGEKASISMSVDLTRHASTDIERLDQLASQHGFTYKVGEDSHAGIVLAGDE